MTKAAPFVKLLQEKQGFLLSVYGTLIFELLITFGIIYSFRDHPRLSHATQRSFWFYFLLSLGLILLITFVPMPMWLKLVLFTVFAVLQGACLHSASALLPKELIDQALMGAIGIFVALSVVGVILAYMGYDLSWMALVLLGALIGLVVAILISMFFKLSRGLHRLILIVALVIFGAYVMFETNVMLQKNYNQDFLSAAINFYLDFLSLFANLLSLSES